MKLKKLNATVQSDNNNNGEHMYFSSINTVRQNNTN